jgi:uncharacterized repeat protein (TIGR01451 family)
MSSEQLQRHKAILCHGVSFLMAKGWLYLISVFFVFPLSVFAKEIQNTATVHYQIEEGAFSIPSNTDTFTLLPSPVPAIVLFWQYIPGVTINSQPSAAGPVSPRRLLKQEGPTLSVNEGLYKTGSGRFEPLPVPTYFSENPIDQFSARLMTTSIYHVGDSIVITVDDGNRNIDPDAREFVEIHMASSSNDTEVLRLKETGADTGLFAATIKTVSISTSFIIADGYLSVGPGDALSVEYKDDLFPTLDHVEATVLVDPFGIVFDSANGTPINDAKVTLINNDTGQTATVYGDDGVSLFPSSVMTGNSIADSSGKAYNFFTGQFRFPFVPVGNYRLIVEPPDPYTAPSTVPLVDLKQLRNVSGRPFSIVTGSLGEVFTVLLGPAINIDIPIDRSQNALRLEKGVSRSEVSAGDFLQYHLTLTNLNHKDPTSPDSNAGAVSEVKIEDRLPLGMRFEPGSLRRGGLSVSDPAISMDGRAITITVGAVSAEGHMEFTYVALVGAGSPVGEAVNHARAVGKGGVSSNKVSVSVQIREPLLRERFTLIGRVVEGDCKTPINELKGVENIRILMEDGSFVLTDPDGQYHFNGVRPGTHVVQMDTGTLPTNMTPLSCVDNSRSAGNAASQFVDAAGGTLWRADFYLTPVTAATSMEDVLPPPSDPFVKKRPDILSDIKAAGGETDWLLGQEPGFAWLFPEPDHNPRSPAIRVVIKHEPHHIIQLKSNGRPVNPVSFDGTQSLADQVSVSIWRGIPLIAGDNLLEADVIDATGGGTVATVTRRVHYANQADHVQWVPEESVLVADGIHKPVIALRLLDRHNRPVRAGVSGEYTINPPYVPETIMENDPLSFHDEDRPQFMVEGDDGMAYITLAPTTESGAVVLSFDLPGRRGRVQEIRVWLTSELQDFILVGFAEGTVGFDKLSGNMEALAEQGRKEGLSTSGNTSLYAKGQILGKWLLTLSYDSDKPEESLGRKGLFSTIDPNAFYTLYGDRSTQHYDGSSRENLYLKLSHDTFYFLFGDYDTGLTETQLSRYSRNLTGLKTEYHGALDLTLYASETDQHSVRNEMQGNGTSGLYRLTHPNILINSERIRIETRDRLRSERIIKTESLIRYIDYDIDYSAGTVLFRKPIASRDTDFSPIFIVIEYEAFGVVGRDLNFGGRAGTHLFNDRLIVGGTYIQEGNYLGETYLSGMDMKWGLGADTELRLEIAGSHGQAATVNHAGEAALVELTHHTDRVDTLAYLLRQEPDFGLGQQNGSERGTKKIGLDSRLRMSEAVSLEGELYQQDNLITEASRNVANAQLTYHSDWGAVNSGVQWAKDTVGATHAESRQALVGGSRYFLDRKLELHTQGEFLLGDSNHSVDFPARYLLGATYGVSNEVQLILAEEWTKGLVLDTSTTRIGVHATLWKGARLTSTMNQSGPSKTTPDTFGQVGLSQTFQIGERWRFDLSTDHNRRLNETSTPSASFNPAYPTLPSEDFVAVSGGVGYLSDLWSGEIRIENRNGGTTDRAGLTMGLFRLAQEGVAFALSAQAFEVQEASGTNHHLANTGLSWAFRPLGHRWSALEKLELRYDEIENGTGISGSNPLGNTGLNPVGDGQSKRIINNIVLNHVSRPWTKQDQKGNLFVLHQRYQGSLYYGSKYVVDQMDQVEYGGYTDLTGVEWRYDLTRRIDIGLRVGMLHSYRASQIAYSWGPQWGFWPIENIWVTLGYNLIGFNDADFKAAGYTANGFYLKFRMKFDQNTPFPGMGR